MENNEVSQTAVKLFKRFAEQFQRFLVYELFVYRIIMSDILRKLLKRFTGAEIIHHRVFGDGIYPCGYRRPALIEGIQLLVNLYKDAGGQILSVLRIWHLTRNIPHYLVVVIGIDHVPVFF